MSKQDIPFNRVNTQGDELKYINEAFWAERIWS